MILLMRVAGLRKSRKNEKAIARREAKGQKNKKRRKKEEARGKKKEGGKNS